MKQTIKTDQAGVVAIMITMIMMFVITLLVLGFSEATRRNQREALDTQLGTQAYYAAETGINDIMKAANAGTTLVNNPDCGSFSLGGKTFPRVLKKAADGTAEVANTCLIVDTTPAQLQVDGISPGSDSVMWKVSNASGLNFSKLTFAWSPDPNPLLSSNCSNDYRVYPIASEWKCNRALLRVDILRADLATTDADQLAASTTTLYLSPTSGSQQNVSIGPTLFNPLGNFGSPIAQQGGCHTSTPTNTDQGCHVDVTFNTLITQSSQYYVRLTALYADAKNVTLAGTNAIVGGASHFKDGQIVVDSTGRAQDQLKRIQVHIPLSKASTSQPIFAAQSAGSICKDLQINTNLYQDNCPKP